MNTLTKWRATGVLLIGAVALAGCVPVTVPPGSATVAGFTTQSGMPGLVIKALQVDGYGLIFPGSTMNPSPIRESDGMANVRLARQLSVDGENVLLRSTATRPATVFIYDDGRFIAPSVERVVQRGAAPRHGVVHPGPGRSPPAPAAVTPTETDSLPPVGNSVPFSLDQ